MFKFPEAKKKRMAEDQTEIKESLSNSVSEDVKVKEEQVSPAVSSRKKEQRPSRIILESK